MIKIHKEGRRILFVTLLVLLALNLLLSRYNGPNVVFNRIFAGVSVVAFLTLLQFFRSPFRRLLTHEDLLLAPADGKVVVIEEVFESEYFEDARRQISVFMSPINVHITRNPVSGIVRYFKYHPRQVPAGLAPQEQHRQRAHHRGGRKRRWPARAVSANSRGHGPPHRVVRERRRRSKPGRRVWLHQIRLARRCSRAA